MYICHTMDDVHYKVSAQVKWEEDEVNLRTKVWLEKKSRNNKIRSS